jgi:transposase, IS30 family
MPVAVVVLTDRATLHTKLSLLKSKETNSVCNKFIARLKPLKSLIKTITFDNDQAFSKHERIAKKLEASTFFTRPYTSQDKGTVENRIGVLRRFIPKKTDLRKLSNKRIREIEHLINNRPIRKFNYQTANQIFTKKLHLLLEHSIPGN